MAGSRRESQELRRQIESVKARVYSTDQIEHRIADSLLGQGRFEDELSAGELAVILRNVVYALFARYTFDGRSISLLHNVPSMKVSIRDGQADISCVVHIHRPIVAFLEFGYALVNDPVAITPGLRLKKGSFRYTENTRRFDLKARAALAAVNVRNLALKELTDATGIIRATLPSRLSQHGLSGELAEIELWLQDSSLRVMLTGEFRRRGKGGPS
jgi:hypothetical protein